MITTLKTMKRKFLPFVALLLFLPLTAIGQEPGQPNGSENTINVFIDGQIDENLIKEEFPYVNYVRTRDASDVHVLVARSMTGAGSQYEFYFMGLKEFAGKTDTLSYFSSGQETQTETREGYTKVLKMGLMRYLALSNNILDINIVSGAAPRGGSVVEEDPWDSWVFEIDLRGNFSAVDTRKTQNYSGGIDISRVTPEWRHELGAEYDYGYQEFTSGNYHSTSETVETSLEVESIKSLGPNAGLGLIGHLEKNTVDNLDLNYKLTAAIEYNFFPYEMSSRRQATIGYYLGIDGRNYIDSTIFDVTEELIPYEQLSIGYSQREQWGNIFTSITFSNFLKDFSKNNLNMTAGLNIRIWRGLSWNLSGSFSLINDDVNISKKEVRPEDLLLGTRQLSTSQSLRFNTGISLTFGSMYNNVVNTRLRGSTMGGGGFSGGGYSGGGFSGGGGIPGGGRFR